MGESWYCCQCGSEPTGLVSSSRLEPPYCDYCAPRQPQLNTTIIGHCCGHSVCLCGNNNVARSNAESGRNMRPSFDKDTILIAVHGVTGSGKSRFIESMTQGSSDDRILSASVQGHIAAKSVIGLVYQPQYKTSTQVRMDFAKGLNSHDLNVPEEIIKVSVTDLCKASAAGSPLGRTRLKTEKQKLNKMPENFHTLIKLHHCPKRE